ncbi:glycosyltransferase [Neosynechococcus sphagnicola]|uniref:glycosyltransferase n=1 Tax=Neosynechococcus sphagnicola TaxID=1501145 RepID=UPI001EF9FCFD|nr:glycosyltransferase [Neosynechococcus sphagnicola]
MWAFSPTGGFTSGGMEERWGCENYTSWCLGRGGKFACGGLWAELKTMHLAQQICEAEVVTYRQREPDTLFLADLLRSPHLDQAIFVISWGFDVAKLAAQLRPYNVLYHAHSAGYGFHLPASVPIITVSRNTLGYWGQRSPQGLLYYLPNQIGEEFHNRHLQRDIEVLVQARKSSTYLMQVLIPALRQHCQVYVVDRHVPDLAALFNRAHVYLYDSAEYWALQGVSEGFGLQPMEALACGCQVFSSVNGGLSDYLDPGFNCYKIAGYSAAYDLQRILKVLQMPSDSTVPESLIAEYRSANILQRLGVILSDINHFFDHRSADVQAIAPLTPWRLLQLRSQRFFSKVSQKYSRLLSQGQ